LPKTLPCLGKKAQTDAGFRRKPAFVQSDSFTFSGKILAKFVEGIMLRRLVGLATLIVMICSAAAADAPLRVSPEMELLAGVLSQTTWIETRGPEGQGNEYFRALQEFFADYQGHEAVILAQELTDKGFAYDAPPAFICHLGPLPELNLAYEYSDYLKKRAGGRQVLEEFRLALADLAVQSDFLSFYAEWKPYLDECLAPCLQGFRRDDVEAWLSEFFGWAPAEFHLIVTPSMFPGGGYGATVEDSEGNSIAFQIIREFGCSEDVPEFPSGVSLESLTCHELGHSFVNPSLEAHPERAKALKPLLWPVRNTMAEQAYTSVAAFLNEQVIRAMEVVAARDLFSPEIELLILENNEKNGFYLTQFVVEQLEYYQANRDQYPQFTDFVPYLYDRLTWYQDEHSTWEARLFSKFLR
jgi:hypothetical protein